MFRVDNNVKNLRWKIPVCRQRGGEGSRFTEGSFVLGHFYISHAGTIGRGRGEQVMGEMGRIERFVSKEEWSEPALHVEVDSFSGPVCVGV